MYGSIITAGVHRASSIKVAEAAKVIENTQRDLNIALMNELALIFHKIGIDTLEVLEAAGTKWNFLPFRPGLVGGHCIGVDPYYLTHKADKLGYHPQVILAGRRINDGMGKYIAEQTVKQMIQSGSPVKGADVNVLGLTFKENCPDIRNSQVIDVVRELASYGANVHVHDPVADPGRGAARIRHRARSPGTRCRARARSSPRSRTAISSAARPTTMSPSSTKAGCTSTSSARPTPRSFARAASTSGGCDRGYARRARSALPHAAQRCARARSAGS